MSNTVFGALDATPSATSGPLELGDPGVIAELRGTLLQAGFTGEGVRRALGSAGKLLSRSADIPLHERRLDGVEPLGTLVKLLILDAAVAADSASSAFTPLRLEQVERLGLLESGAGEVRSLVRIVPHDELLIASDRRSSALRETRSDHVAGVQGPSLTLSHLTVRSSVETALDVGTGCGIQAILAAQHSGHVVATDVNMRALNFAAFNGLLNGVENIELRAGSFFEPVAGSRFQLVTCNPPYVISPDTDVLYRDSGLARDTVSRQVVESAPAVLDEGGFAQMLVSWVVPAGGDWDAPLRSWVDGGGCDAWLLHHGTDDVLTHTGNWLRHEVGNESAEHAAVIDRWLAYFDREGIEQIAAGAVILRRRNGVNWVRTDELPSDRLRPAGEHILRVFAAQDFLAGIDERALLDERLALADSCRLEQRVVFDGGEWAVDNVGLTMHEGLGFHATLDVSTAGMLAALYGRRTLGEVVDELARLEGSTRTKVAQAALPIVRELLAAGFLVRR